MQNSLFARCFQNTLSADTYGQRVLVSEKLHHNLQSAGCRKDVLTRTAGQRLGVVHEIDISVPRERTKYSSWYPEDSFESFNIRVVNRVG